MILSVFFSFRFLTLESSFVSGRIMFKPCKCTLLWYYIYHNWSSLSISLDQYSVSTENSYLFIAINNFRVGLKPYKKSRLKPNLLIKPDRNKEILNPETILIKMEFSFGR